MSDLLETINLQIEEIKKDAKEKIKKIKETLKEKIAVLEKKKIKTLEKQNAEILNLVSGLDKEEVLQALKELNAKNKSA